MTNIPLLRLTQIKTGLTFSDYNYKSEYFFKKTFGGGWLKILKGYLTFFKYL